jgi:hypothetical protein
MVAVVRLNCRRRSGLNLKIAIASAIGSLFGLALLFARRLRQKQTIAAEVSSLRHLGSRRARGAVDDIEERPK